MKGRRLALVSVVAAFSLLAFVLSTWMKPLSNYSPQQISHSERIYNFVPTSASVHITAVKPRIAGVTGGSTLLISILLLTLPQDQKFSQLDRHYAFVANAPRPLWLLNRSLLI
jgi:hypothetical protein